MDGHAVQGGEEPPGEVDRAAEVDVADSGLAVGGGAVIASLLVLRFRRKKTDRSRLKV